MSNLSLLSKNAHLAVYVTEHMIYANLAYSHYDEEKFEVLRDISWIPQNLGVEELPDFWLDYFENLEKVFTWSIFTKTSNLASLRSFEDEGYGVNGCSVKVVKTHSQYKELIRSLREFSLDLKVSTIDAGRKRGLYRSIASYLDYEDCLFLDLNFSSSQITRLTKRVEKSGKFDYGLVESNGILLSMEDIANMIATGQYGSFLQNHINIDSLTNIWANFYLRPTLETTSEIVQDFVRAHIIVQLLKIFNEKSSISKDFGVKKSKNLVWVTGNLIRIPEFKKLLISIIDGLQLRGSFDFCFESENLTYTFGYEFVKGVDADQMIFTKNNFLPNLTKVLIPEIELKAGDRKTVLTGNLKRFGEEKGVEINIMSSEFRGVRVRDPYDTIFEGEFAKKAFLEKYSDAFTLQCFENGISFDKIVFDCRFKPVVYGAGPKENNLKFNVWFASESDI